MMMFFGCVCVDVVGVVGWMVEDVVVVGVGCIGVNNGYCLYGL